MAKIIIPVKGLDSMTKECIESIEKYVENPDILVVDNAGTFNPPKGIEVIRGDDWGFAKSVNEAAKTTDKDLLLLNNDIIATSDFYTPMHNWVGAHIGIVGALLFYPNGTIQHSGSSYNNGNPCHPHKGQTTDQFPEALTNREVECVTFACALISRECWKDLNGLDEQRYPFAYEDIDFCMRAREKRYKIICCGEAQLIHKEHLTQRKYLSQVRPKSDESIRNLRERWGKLSESLVAES